MSSRLTVSNIASNRPGSGIEAAAFSSMPMKSNCLSCIWTICPSNTRLQYLRRSWLIVSMIFSMELFYVRQAGPSSPCSMYVSRRAGYLINRLETSSGRAVCSKLFMVKNASLCTLMFLCYKQLIMVKWISCCITILATWASCPAMLERPHIAS